MSIEQWFFRWLDHHQFLHPNRGWVTTGHPDAFTFYVGWMECFTRMGATEEICNAASKRMQENPPRFLNEHMPAIKLAIAEVRREQQASSVSSPDQPSREQLKASLDSHSCPECDGTGWALRQAHWPSLRWTPRVCMFCRCPHGRWRKRNDPDLSGSDGRNYDDLQAHPAIWNHKLSFPLWSDRPVSPEVLTDCESEWYYVAPGEGNQVDAQEGFAALAEPLARAKSKPATRRTMETTMPVVAPVPF